MPADKITGNAIPLLKMIGQTCFNYAQSLQNHQMRMPYRNIEGAFKNIRKMMDEVIQMYEEGAAFETKIEAEQLKAAQEEQIRKEVEKAAKQ
jgi:hypothetical protein